MLAASRESILSRLADDAVVLDVGGWAAPFARADWVIDIMPYETRARPSREEPVERFTSKTWLQRDLCDREPYPFADEEIDFAVCSHTLEDVRDPLWICAELNRIAKAGYIEVPSRLEEQSLGVQGPWAGWSHHRWLVDVEDGQLEFCHKPHLVNVRASSHFPPEFWSALDPAERVQSIFWEGEFTCRERVFVEARELDRYLDGFVSEHAAQQPQRGLSLWQRARQRLSR
jgi:hypothetical protein